MKPQRPKLSFTTMGTPGRPLREILQLAQHYGFSGVDLRCSSQLGELAPDTPADRLAEIRELMAEAELELPSLLCYASTTPGDRAWELRLAKELAELLRTAQALGAQSIRIFGPPLGDDRDSPWLKPFASAIANALAETAATRLFIQNHKGGSTVRDCVKLARQLDETRFGIVYAPDHGHAYDSIPCEEQWGLVAPHTGLIYLSDLVHDAQTFRPALPGSGEVPLNETLDHLFAQGFAGYCSFKWEKIWHAELPDFEVAVPHFFALAGISKRGPK